MKFLSKTKIFKGLANFIDKRVKKQSQKYSQGDTVEEGDVWDKNQLIDNNHVTHRNSEDGKDLIKKRLLKIFGVFCFVAIPLPLTGIWMGVCIAVMLGLNFWETFISVQLGNLVAGIIISTICVIFPQFTHYLIYIFVILVIIVIIIEIIRNKIKKIDKNSN